MKKRTNGQKMTAYHISGQYIDPDASGARPIEFEFRNADLRYLDQSSRNGQVVEFRVFQEGNDEETVDHVQVYSPNVWMYRGMITMKGFVQSVKRDGKLLDPHYGSLDVPMRLMDITLRSEAALDDDGKWLDNR
jgi:hypothetical protein